MSKHWGGGEKKKVPQIKNQPGLKKGQKKSQLEFATLVGQWTRRDEKGAPISAPSIHIGVSSLWPSSMTISQEDGSLNLLYSSIPGGETFSCEVGLSYHLTLGPLFGECSNPRALGYALTLELYTTFEW